MEMQRLSTTLEGSKYLHPIDTNFEKQNVFCNARFALSLI